MNSKKKFEIRSFYRFIKVKNKEKIKRELDEFFKNKIVKGTILLSNEGINGSLSGTEADLNKCIRFIKFKIGIKKINSKTNKVEYLPFNRLKIRLKKEIVSLGKGEMDINKLRGKLVSPEKWNEIITKKNIKIIDVRNIYEISIGKFKGAFDPKTNNFREFPESFKKLNLDKKDEIGMYCTGGIRCEKASSLLRKLGYKNVYQLEGGIINYLNYIRSNKKRSLWYGECFVFDERVTINKNLEKGKYLQCYGCRRPIQKKDTKSFHYKKGVHCPYCYKSRTKKQKERSATRQGQIEKAIADNTYNPFIKIKNI
jgi:UPF0176 protein